MRFKFLILLLVILIVMTGCAKTTYETNETEVFGVFTKSELEEDAQKLMSIIKSYSPKLYTDEDELQFAYQSAIAQFEEGMSGIRFIQLMKPVVAALRCGHTHIYANFDWDKIRMIPMEMKFIDGRLYLISNAVETGIPEGSEITEINGRTADELISKMLNGSSADGYNETAKFHNINRMFPREYMMNVEYAFSFDIKYISPDGKSRTKTVQAEKYDKVRNKIWKPVSKLYESEFSDDYAILTVRSFNPNTRATIGDYNEFFDEFFEKVSEKGVGNIILDVRGNSGGDPMITSHLFSYLQKEPHPYFSTESPNYYPGLKDDIQPAENHFEGSLYVLIDGGSFSSTGHLISLLKYQGAAVFIGEESGAHYVCTDSSRDRTLTHTGINFHYSTEAWAVAVEGLEPGRGIMPDHEIIPTLDDYLNDNDPALDFALSLVKN